MKTASKYRNSRGFSMIEILVAIGILVVLIGIVAFTVSSVTGGAKKNETKVRMEALNAMLTELNTTAKFKKQPSKMYYDSPATAYTNPATDPPVPPFDIWKDADPSDNATTPTPLGKPLFSPGNVTEDLFRAEATNASKPAARIRSAAVLNTQLVMGLLASVPRNQSTLANLPPKSFMDNPNANGGFSAANMGPILVAPQSTPDPDKKAPFKPSVLVDGWGNPIIFVPSAGLRGVTLKEHGPTEFHIITSTGKLIEEADVGGPPNFATYVPPGDAQPFFASAGPDGDFSTGDDNVYSFEN